MGPKKASVIVSGIRVVFSRSKSEQQASTAPDRDAETASIESATTEVPFRVSQDTVRATTPADKQIDAIISEPAPDSVRQIPPSSEETVVPVPAVRLTAAARRTASTRPSDIIARHAALLPTRGPQPYIVDLHTELLKTGSFLSPLPINPAAASLTRAHFRCFSQHNCLRKSSNLHAPTLCTTCHGGGDAELAQCRSCYLRICRKCAGLLLEAGNDLEGLLEELVKLGVWKGLQGQG